MQNKRYNYTRRNKQKKKLSFERKILVQGISCALIFAVCFGISKSDAPTFVGAKQFIAKSLNETMDFRRAFTYISNTFVKLTNELPSIVVKPADEIVPASEPDMDVSEPIVSNAITVKAAENEIDLNPPIVHFKFPYTGKLTSEFGAREHPILAEASNHRGVDVAGNKGNTVISAAPGRVEKTGWDDTYGNYIYVRHNDRYKTFYAHLSKVCVVSGEIVDDNTKIGEIGAEGLATGPHLHFEIREDENPIDPCIYLPFK